VDRLEQAQTIGIRALAFRPVVGKGVRGLDLAELPFAEKATALSPQVLRHEIVVASRPEAGNVPSSTRPLEAE